MKTKQINVHRNGTFEQKIAAILSEDIGAMGKRGFGPLERILRRTLFADNNQIDWLDVADLLAEQNPERKGEIFKIKAAHGHIEGTFKVQIFKAFAKKIWYPNRIGEIFMVEVQENSEGVFTVVSDGPEGDGKHHIAIEDVRIVF